MATSAPKDKDIRVKAIFLDIDGVLVTPTTMKLNYLLGRPPETQWYDPATLSYLGRLVSQTGAMVVLSSTWRSAAGAEPTAFERAVMDNLYAQLSEAGAPVADVTPQVEGSDRSAEVGAWLDEHPCEAYVILDDLARFETRPDVAAGHLVRIEGSEGMKSWHYWRALELLQS